MVGTQKPVWIVAVSGGIDSVVLLDILHKHSNAKLVVAHVDHGIRDDGDEDLRVVRMHASRIKVPLETIKLDIGDKRDEASARSARYEWLESVRKKHDADAVVTAHHQDDVLETIIINHIRGTGWKGLCSLRSHPSMLRPLVHMSKARVIAYALSHQLEWRDDSTNEDSRYLRNAVRQLVIPRLTSDQRRELIGLYHQQILVAGNIKKEMSVIQKVAMTDTGLSVYWLIMVPELVASELIQTFVGSGLQARHTRQILHFARTAKPGAKLHIPPSINLSLTADDLIVSHP